jgi:PKD repeat protein
MVDATSFVFTPQGAQDANGDALTFAWRFGDGATASGASATYVYRTTGSFTVDLTVSDGRVTVSAPSAKVDVGANLTSNWRHVSSTDRQCSDASLITCSVFAMQTTSLTQSGNQVSGAFTPNVNFVPTGFVAFAFTGTVDPVAHPATVRFSTPDQPVAALQNDTYSFSFEGRTDVLGTTMIGTLTQTRKHRPQANPFGVVICGSREPVVTCPPDVRTSTSTFAKQ